MIRVKANKLAAWKKHKERWSGCTRCILQETRSQVVLARGYLPCDVLFIGEAPGDSENSLGEPFAGASGSLLNEIIAKAAEEVGIVPRLAFTNVVCCRPPRTESKLRPPDKKEAKACSSRLMEFIRIAEPTIIVTVGKVAQRFPPKDYRYDQIKKFNIVHPSFILQKESSVDYHRTKIALKGIFESLIPF